MISSLIIHFGKVKVYIWRCEWKLPNGELKLFDIEMLDVELTSGGAKEFESFLWFDFETA